MNLKGRGFGFVTVRTSEEGEALLRIPVYDSEGKEVRGFRGLFKQNLTDKEAIYIGYEGEGKFKFLSFELE